MGYKGIRMQDGGYRSTTPSAGGFVDFRCLKLVAGRTIKLSPRRGGENLTELVEVGDRGGHDVHLSAPTCYSEYLNGIAKRQFR